MDTQLKKAFEETLEARIISTVPDMPDHRFSPQFERKMKRLAGGGAPSTFSKDFSLRLSAPTLPFSLPIPQRLPRLLKQFTLLMCLRGLRQKIRL